MKSAKNLALWICGVCPQIQTDSQSMHLKRQNRTVLPLQMRFENRICSVDIIYADLFCFFQDRLFCVRASASSLISCLRPSRAAARLSFLSARSFFIFSSSVLLNISSVLRIFLMVASIFRWIFSTLSLRSSGFSFQFQHPLSRLDTLSIQPEIHVMIGNHCFILDKRRFML